MFKNTEKLWDVLGEIIAVILVVTYAVMIINANFNFIQNATLLYILDIIRTYGSLVLIGVVWLEAISKRNFIFQIVFLALCAIIVVFMFFPGTYANLIGLIAPKA